MNSIEMLELLRDNVNEATASQWSDVNLVRRLNMAQRKWGLIVAQTPGQWLIKSVSVIPVASVITLPADCSKPIYLEETSSGRPISFLSSVTHRRVSRSVGTSLDVGYREAYPLINTLEVNKDSYVTACTLWYQQRVPDLHTGTAGAATVASAIEFADDLNKKFIDDYYNGSYIEVMDQSTSILDLRSEISDYAASTGIAVVTGTVASGDTYGTISVLPEETHMMLVMDATVMALMKPSSTLDKDVLKFYISEFRRMQKEVEGWLMSRTPGSEGTLIGDPY